MDPFTTSLWVLGMWTAGSFLLGVGFALTVVLLRREPKFKLPRYSWNHPAVRHVWLVDDRESAT